MNYPTQMRYFPEEDIIHLALSDKMEANSIKISPNITAEINENEELIGIEILKDSSFLKNIILNLSLAAK